MLLNYIDKCPCGAYILDKVYWQKDGLKTKKECINSNCPFTIKLEYKYHLSDNSN